MATLFPFYPSTKLKGRLRFEAAKKAVLEMRFMPRFLDLEALTGKTQWKKLRHSLHAAILGEFHD